MKEDYQYRNYHDAHWFHRWIRTFASTPFGIWFGSNFLHYLDGLVMYLSRGQTSLSNWISGLPIVLLTSTGAKSGLSRSVPLVGIEDGKKWILVASSWGRQRHPGWYYNLLKHPEAKLTTPSGEATYNVHLADNEEFELYWEKAIHLYPGYAIYQKSARHRTIALFVLQPVSMTEYNKPDPTYHSPA